MQAPMVSQRRLVLGGAIDREPTARTCVMRFWEVKDLPISELEHARSKTDWMGRDQLRFPFVNQNISSQLWHRLRELSKIIIGPIGRDEIDETCHGIVLRGILICPSEDQRLRRRYP